MKSKQIIRLTEADLHSVIKESVKKIITEIGNTPNGLALMQAAANRAYDQGRDEDAAYIEDSIDNAYQNNMSDYEYAARNRINNYDDGDWQKYHQFRKDLYNQAFYGDDIARDENGEYSNWDFDKGNANYGEFRDKYAR